jgi:KDO2-lipid IV(A) lauroyltransferase
VDTGDRDADLIANIQRLNDLIGEQILEHPEQWLWLHNRWKADPDNGV